MVGEAHDVAQQLAAIRQQLASLGRQLAALTEQHKQLAAVVSQAWPRRAEGKPAGAPEHPPGVPGRETIAQCGQDILRVLREVGRPLTTLEILEELVHRHLSWRESTVSHTLADLVAEGLVQDTNGHGPRRHGLAKAATL
jgi:hypothetical protein